ncbi:alpha/beta hydrolase [Mesorhizobium sp.]|uniref:alpha/beta hydrolase n=1 Tax=Mesorhizobium sp. TaxID=1871066 RepID=UPI003567B092
MLGALAFAASLTPSLIPRTALVQGVVAGLAFTLAYGAGAAVSGALEWLGLRGRPFRYSRLAGNVVLLAAVLIASAGLASATHWQNSIRLAMNMPPVETMRPFLIAGVAVVVTLVFLALGHLFRGAIRLASRQISRVLPPRAAALSGLILSAVLFWGVGDGVLLRGFIYVIDNSYKKVDRYLPPESAAPAEAWKSGSSASAIAWDTLGAEGRNRVLSPPSQQDIAELAGTGSMAPLRVYVGLNSAETPDERAALALAELLRIGGFDRKVLVIATPTGTGWVDPAAMAPVEILTHGDIASVSVQYSYLPSWLSLLTEPDYGKEAARAVFQAIYGHWRDLPKAKRPKLYLFGLSLGALNSDLSVDAFDMLGDPIDGALWVGPPYESRTWNQITAKRAKDSAVWLPIYGDGSLFRFQNQTGEPPGTGATWGRTRIVYLQYASDPIVFFDAKSLWRPPAWLASPRGPDVSKELRWIPLVTFLQQVCDVVTATLPPHGSGHVYAANDYMRAWISVTQATGWSDTSLAQLKRWFAASNL